TCIKKQDRNSSFEGITQGRYLTELLTLPLRAHGLLHGKLGVRGKHTRRAGIISGTPFLSHESRSKGNVNFRELSYSPFISSFIHTVNMTEAS
ncbi:hypothetical protein ACC754_38440, partial [Rhizobium johnstonii]